jgi:hypothetical protein
MASYTYTQVDFLASATVDVADLQTQIENSAISSATLQYIDYEAVGANFTVIIYFSNALTTGDKTILDNLIATYVVTPPPIVEEVIVSTTEPAIITNKSLDTQTNYFIDLADDTKKLAFDTASNTTNTTLTLASQTTADRTIIFPDISDTVVTLTATQTLTNKTITNAIVNGLGNTNSALSTIYINPSSTSVSGANNYYFSYFNQPLTTGSTTGSAYTVYIQNAPSGTITNPYAFYVNSGKTYIGGSLQIPNGAVDGYYLRTDAVGNVSWAAVSGGPGGGTFADGTALAPGIAFTNELSTGFYRPGLSQIGVALGGVEYVRFKTTGIDIFTGQTLNVGTSGNTSTLNVYGLITGTNGLTISAGSTSLQSLSTTTINASGLITGTNGLTITGANTSLTTLSTSGLISANAGITIANGQTLNIGTSGNTSTLNAYGLITGTNGLTISAGATSLQSLSTTTINASGLITGTNGLTISAGSTSLQSLSTTTINASGLITGTNGLTISAGATSLQSLSSTTINASGLITANAGINIANGQTLNVGASGITNTLNMYGLLNVLGIGRFGAVGSNTPSNSTLSVTPTSTSITGANNYYFNYFGTPTTSGATTGSAYTLYIQNEPAGTISFPYALYVNSGKTFIGGGLQIPTGAQAGYLLQTDANGNVSWVSPVANTSIPYFSVTTTDTQSTTSATAINIPGVTITPDVSGIYYAIFLTLGRSSNNNRTVGVQLAVNGTQVPNSLSSYNIASANFDITLFSSAIVTCNGTTDTVTAQFFISAQTVTLSNQKILTLIKVG